MQFTNTTHGATAGPQTRMPNNSAPTAAALDEKHSTRGMKRLYVHIGTHKTGSSAIQAALVALRAGADLLYPHTGRVSNGGHLNLAWEAVNDKRFRPDRGTSKELVREILAARPRVTILSAETFSAWPGTATIPTWIKHLGAQIRARRVDIIGYVRPQWDYLESHYTQMIKIGATSHPFADFVAKERDRPLFEYPLVFSEWTAHFRSFVHVRPYSANAVLDFFSLVGLPTPQVEERVNVRPGMRQLEMLRRLGDEVELPSGSREAIFRRATRYLERAIPDDQPGRYLTREIVRDIHHQFRASNSVLAAQYWKNALPRSFQMPLDLPEAVGWDFGIASRNDLRVFGDLMRRVSRWLQELPS